MLAEIQKFNKTRLNPTETVERHLVAVTGSSTTFGHSNEEDVKEYFDSEQELVQKISEVVALIQNSKHLVIYTGAGISTSASIPDYRGPQGKWFVSTNNADVD